MKKTGNIELITVGKLLKDLKKYEKKSSDYVVNINIPDGSILNVIGAGLDKDGDLNVEVDEDPDEGFYDVQTLIDELDGYDKDTKVYMEGCGLYLTFGINPKGSLLSADNDGDETVEYEAYAFGEYKYEPSGWLTEAEKRELAEQARKEAREERIKGIVLAVMCVALFIWLCCNVYTLIAHTGRPVWESIMWIAVCILLLFVCGGTLYYSKEK